MDLHHVWLHQLVQDFLAIEHSQSQSHLSLCALYVRLDPLPFMPPQLRVPHQFFPCHLDEEDYLGEEKPHLTQH